MNDEIYGLRADIEALRLECAELRAMMAQQQQTGQDYDSDLLESIIFRAPTPDEAPRAPSEMPPRRPFDVWYDFTDEEWKTYLPDGCITVGGAEAEFDGDKSQDVASMLAAEDVYCHVFADDDKYKYKFSTEPEDDDALYIFPVAKFTPDAKEVTALLAGAVQHFESPRKKAYVVTGVSQTMDGDHGLVLHVTKAPVLVGEPSGSESSASLSESSSSTTVATLAEFTAVSGSVYDPNTHQFYNRLRTVKVLADVNSDNSESASVFTAVSVCTNQ